MRGCSESFGHSASAQGHAYGANLYLPGNYLNTPLFDLSADPYAFRSQLGGALCLGWDPRVEGFDLPLAIDRVSEFKAVRHLFVGDFYPLMAYNLRATEWIGYQFHRDDLGEGIALFLRRGKSPYTTAAFSLRGLLPDAVYELKFEDTGESRSARGLDVSLPLTVTIEGAPGSALLTYQVQRT